MLINQSFLTREGALRWLRRLEETTPAFTAYLAASMPGPDIEKTLLAVLDRGQLLDEITSKVVRSPTGAVVFYIMNKAFVLWPPFPVVESRLIRSYDPAPLVSMLEHDWKLALVLVRLGHFAVAVFQGKGLIDYKAGTGLVHGRHHKGGSSANRFARHREKQMESFFTRVEIHSREVLEARIKDIDYVIYGGARETLQAMWRQCSFFRKLQDKTIERLLSVREPKRSSLEDAVAQAYASTLYEMAERAPACQ